jgi:hypothetical protein
VKDELFKMLLALYEYFRPEFSGLFVVHNIAECLAEHRQCTGGISKEFICGGEHCCAVTDALRKSAHRIVIWQLVVKALRTIQSRCQLPKTSCQKELV